MRGLRSEAVARLSKAGGDKNEAGDGMAHDLASCKADSVQLGRMDCLTALVVAAVSRGTRALLQHEIQVTFTPAGSSYAPCMLELNALCVQWSQLEGTVNIRYKCTKYIWLKVGQL